MVSIKKIYKSFISETNLIISDKSVLLTILVAPMLYIFFLGSIYLNKDADHIKLAIVDYDNTAITKQFKRLIQSNPTIEFVGYMSDYKSAAEKMYNFDIQGFLIFPDGFEKDLKELNGADVKLYLNTTQFLPSNTLNKAVQKVLLTISAGIRIKAFESQGLDPRHAYELALPLNAEVKPISNPTNNYGDFLLPGLFLLILQQTLLIGLGESITHNRMHNKLKKMLKENGIFNLIAGKSLFYVLLYFSYFLILFAGIFSFFQLNNYGDRFTLILLSTLFFASILFYTYFVASFFKSPLIYMEVMAFTTYPIFLTTGYSWPVSAMPVFLQWISKIIPTTPAMSAYIKLTQLNASFLDVKNELINLFVLLILSVIAVFFRYRYLKKQYAN